MAERDARSGTGRAVEAVVFDAYGTLFDVASAARQAAAEPEREVLRERWPRIAAAWRVRQLEYAWLRSITGAYRDFWGVTQDALDWALENEGLEGDDALRRRLLDLYWELPAYGDAADCLRRIRSRGLPVAILSNASPGMLDAAIRSAGIESLIDDVLCADSVRTFKPHRTVYRLACDRFERPAEAVAFVSANGWDAASAQGFGFRAVWVNRDRTPPERLAWRPETEVSGLAGVPEAVGAMRSGAAS